MFVQYLEQRVRGGLIFGGLQLDVVFGLQVDWPKTRGVANYHSCTVTVFFKK